MVRHGEAFNLPNRPTKFDNCFISFSETNFLRNKFSGKSGTGIGKNRFVTISKNQTTNFCTGNVSTLMDQVVNIVNNQVFLLSKAKMGLSCIQDTLFHSEILWNDIEIQNCLPLLNKYYVQRQYNQTVSTSSCIYPYKSENWTNDPCCNPTY